MVTADTIRYSVIIPVYNNEKTLERCLRSLTAQNREDVQIIVVNDGSQDDSGSIAHAFADQYENIECIDQVNAGVSKARNSGLDHAKGNYVLFIDSDDYIVPDYFSALDKAKDSDLLVFASIVESDSLDSETDFLNELQQEQKYPVRLERLVSSRKIMPPWNKRFKRSILEEKRMRFIEGMQIGEDFNFCLAYAMECETIEILSTSLYCVDITGENSLSRKYRSDLDKKMCEVFRNAAVTIRNSGKSQEQKNALLGILDYLFIKNVFTCIAEEFKHRKLSFWKHRKEIKGICDQFRQPISTVRCGTVHRVLRLMLKLKMDFPVYLVAYWVKGRKFSASK